MLRTIVLTLFVTPLSLSVYASSGSTDIHNSDSDYVFDTTLLKGSGLPVDDIINYISNDKIKPGVYSVDIQLNGIFLSHENVDFHVTKESTQPCFSPALIAQLPLKDKATVKSDSCYFLSAVVAQSSVDTDMTKMRVNIIIPETELIKTPRGYVPPDDLNAGETMFLSNYSLNQYYSRFNGSANGDYQSTWVSLNNAINFGQWQLRQQGSWSHSSPGKTLWSSNRAYLQRPILPIRSSLTVGDSYTAGNFFSGMAFRGVSLASDDRMLPQSQQGYAPVVRGVARSNARVTVSQGKAVIYETTVPPGSFEISDLYPVSYSGDLAVTVTEADGSVSTFTVPYAAGPESVRQGMFKYAAIAGRSRYVGDEDPFTEFTLQYGVSNNVTTNLGSRLAQGYFSAVMGAVHSSELGAFGLDSTFSQADLPNGSQTGWMFHASYSKRIEPTNTTIAIAGYRYSTAGYRDLPDVFGLRQAWEENKQDWTSTTLNQSSRFEVSVTQDMDALGSVWLSGSTQAYRDGRSPDKQYQFGYSKQFANGMSINASIARTRYSEVYRSTIDGGIGYDNYINNYYSANQQTLSSVSVSIPFGQNRQTTLSSTYTQQNGIGSTLQSTLSGVTDSERPLSYGVTYARDYDNTHSVGGTLQTATTIGSLQGTLSHGKNYSQGSAGLQGAVVIHKDGITAGPYLGETFALVEAKGAQGATIAGSQNVAIDRFGFALSPSVAPYQYNNVVLDSSGINKNAELVSSSQRIAPLAGAMVRVKFSVIHGYPMLIDIRYRGSLPIGASIYDNDGRSVGTVGQNNQAWVRNDKLEDTLTIQWGNQQSCRLHYHIADEQSHDTIIKTPGECR
ncbi:fimbria/pilus outer membrane usher protein [Kluyvera ascorbata]|uniref:fimbria/pilus outer membrane usher protein n=1 Tax=Kluyvera ascorbata TaxID=51288 RepID=UPI002ABA1198|nr:fimbria/pilus outer membrane usher protein [Kluyvera ascorbata]MDZ4033636.1 fimbria/pilus outer membrane usher protein [Kluyvera ascorbata]